MTVNCEDVNCEPIIVFVKSTEIIHNAVPQAQMRARKRPIHDREEEKSRETPPPKSRREREKKNREKRRKVTKKKRNRQAPITDTMRAGSEEG